MKATFFNSDSGDNIYNAESMRQYISTFFTNGIHQGGFDPVFSSGMTIMVGTGYVNIGGDIQYFPSQTRITLDIADATYSRVDTIILEHNENTRETTLKAIKGNYGTSSPKAPIRGDGIYQLVIAQVTIPAAALQISQASITDTRSNEYLCGYIASKFEDIDFSQLTAQFSRYFEEVKATDLSAFNTWLENDSEDISDSRYETIDAALNRNIQDASSISGDMSDLITDLEALKATADAAVVGGSHAIRIPWWSGNPGVTIKRKNLIGFIAIVYITRGSLTIRTPIFCPRSQWGFGLVQSGPYIFQVSTSVIDFLNIFVSPYITEDPEASTVTITSVDASINSGLKWSNFGTATPSMSAASSSGYTIGVDRLYALYE